MRVFDILNPSADLDAEQRQREIVDLKKYLKRIQDDQLSPHPLSLDQNDFLTLTQRLSPAAVSRGLILHI